MPLKPIYIALFLIAGFSVRAQLRVVKPVTPQPSRTTLALGAGVTRSVLYMNRNVKENNDATGITASLLYGGAKLARVSLEYSYFKLNDIRPTWLTVRAHTIEGNIHFLARSRNKRSVFYPLFGLSYNIFSGYFTGINDNLNLVSIYQSNHLATTEWLGLNVGTGYEFYFKPGSFFIDYKMRIGIAEGTQHLNIMDVCFSAGLRYNIRVPSIYNIFKGTRARYSLNTEDTDW